MDPLIKSAAVSNDWNAFFIAQDYINGIELQQVPESLILGTLFEHFLWSTFVESDYLKRVLLKTLRCGFNWHTHILFFPDAAAVLWRGAKTTEFIECALSPFAANNNPQHVSKIMSVYKKVRTFLRPPVDLDLNLVSKLASLFIMEHLSVPPIGNLVPRKTCFGQSEVLNVSKVPTLRVPLIIWSWSCSRCQ